MNSTFAAARSTLLGIAIAVGLGLWILRDLAVLVGYAVLLAYALLPVVRAIERLRDARGRHIPRGVVAAGVMIALVTIVLWSIVLGVPRIASEAGRFAVNAPAVLARLVEDVRVYGASHGLSAWIEPALDGARGEAGGLLQNAGGTLSRGVAGVFGGIGHLLGLALLPLLAFYLLAESEAVRMSALGFVPEEARSDVTRLGGAVDRALRSYVRGQAIVCVLTGVLVATGLALFHHPVAWLLGLLAGAAELIPYLGFMVAAVAIAVAGSTTSVFQALLGVGFYIALNWMIGTFITPRLMGRYLKMHPFVVTVSVLAGARLLGAEGALLALPVAAVLQAVIGELAPAPGPLSGLRPDMDARPHTRA